MVLVAYSVAVMELENKMKKQIITGVLISTLSTACFGSGIPVVDAVGNMETIKQNMLTAQQWVKEAQQFKEQIDNARQQLNQLKEQANTYKNMAGGNWEQVTDVIAESDLEKIYGNMNENALAVLNDYSNLAKNNSLQKIQYNQVAKDIAIADKTIEQIDKENEQLVKLISQMGNANTPAKKADIQTAIQIQTLKIETLKSKADYILEKNKSVSDLKRKEEEQKIKKRFVGDIDLSDEEIKNSLRKSISNISLD